MRKNTHYIEQQNIGLKKTRREVIKNGFTSYKENSPKAGQASGIESILASRPLRLGIRGLLRKPIRALLEGLRAVSRLSRNCPRPLSVLAIVILLLIAGGVVRVWTFRATAPIRYVGDIHNAWVKGSAALLLGDGDFFSGIVELYRVKNDANIDYCFVIVKD